jgi:phage gp46-like protein
VSSLVKIPQRTRPNIQLTPRDHEIRSTLALKIGAVEVAQAARTWWQDTPSGRECAGQRLGFLSRTGHLSMLKLRVHPELPINEPVFIWRPGDESPDFGSISYRLRARWTEPLRCITAFAASRRMGRWFAGRGGPLPRPLQATHDLHVAAIFLRLLKEDPKQARGWVSDQRLASFRRGQKLPDAEIQNESGRTLKVIEFGGSYAPERVRMVHEDCLRRSVPYELW